jgi:hypothetical protein
MAPTGQCGAAFEIGAPLKAGQLTDGPGGCLTDLFIGIVNGVL